MADIQTSADLYNHLLTALRTGEFVPGQRLPTERDYALKFGLTRSAVKGVLNGLQDNGLIFRKPGHGTFVSNRLAIALENLDSGFDKAKGNFKDHVEARLLFEPSIISSVAKIIQREDKQKLKRQLNLVEQAKEWYQFKSSIYQFFRLFYQIYGNQFLLQSFDQIIQARENVEFGGNKSRLSDFVRNAMITSLRSICTPVVNQQPDAAETASREFLTRLLITLEP